MKKYTTYLEFISETFFERPKIGFFVCFTILMLWSFYSYINICSSSWYVPNNLWLATWYKELMINRNLLYLLPLLVSSLALGRFIEKLDLIRNFDKLITYCGKVMSERADNFKVDPYIKITISKELRQLVLSHKEAFEVIFKNTRHFLASINITSNKEYKDVFGCNPSRGCICWEFVFLERYKKTFPTETTHEESIKKQYFFLNISDSIFDISSLDNGRNTLLIDSIKTTTKPENIEALQNLLLDISEPQIQEIFYGIAINDKVVTSAVPGSIFRKYFNIFKIMYQDIDDVNRTDYRIRKYTIFHNPVIINGIIKQLEKEKLIKLK